MRLCEGAVPLQSRFHLFRVVHSTPRNMSDDQPMIRESPTRSTSSRHPFVRQFPASLFWDVNVTELDPNRHASFLVCRVLNHGRRCDVDALWAWYGDERIREIALTACGFERRTLAWLSMWFQLPPSAFSASKKALGSETWRL